MKDYTLPPTECRLAIRNILWRRAGEINFGSCQWRGMDYFGVDETGIKFRRVLPFAVSDQCKSWAIRGIALKCSWQTGVMFLLDFSARAREAAGGALDRVGRVVDIEADEKGRICCEGVYALQELSTAWWGR